MRQNMGFIFAAIIILLAQTQIVWCCRTWYCIIRTSYHIWAGMSWCIMYCIFIFHSCNLYGLPQRHRTLVISCHMPGCLSKAAAFLHMTSSWAVSYLHIMSLAVSYDRTPVICHLVGHSATRIMIQIPFPLNPSWRPINNISMRTKGRWVLKASFCPQSKSHHKSQ